MGTTSVRNYCARRRFQGFVQRVCTERSVSLFDMLHGGIGILANNGNDLVLRLGPGGGILLVVFDFVSGFIRANVL